MSVTILGRFELASRIVLDESTSSWFVVGSEDDPNGTLLSEQLEYLADKEVMTRSATDVGSLVRGSRDTRDAIAVVAAPVPLDDLHLDDARSMLQRTSAGVLVIPMDQLPRLASVAPHFTSWVGNRVFAVEDDHRLADQARQQRLEGLREQFGMSDEEFLAQVERGELSLEPEHAEWLVLLRRDDLLDPLTKEADKP
ncbi:MAG: hypothetical protein AAGF11_44585 [Myxococcota bacterium]